MSTIDISQFKILRVDPQKKSIWFVGKGRIGFAKARKMGFDVESILAASDDGSNG